MKKLLILAALMAVCSLAFADTAANVKNKLEKTLPNFQVTDIRESEIKGLYQLTIPGDVVYSDGKYLMIGHIYTMDGHDLTQAKVDAVIADMASKVDKSAALKIGNGKKTVIEFSDPECPYCIRAEEFFKGADVTRYIYFMPLSFHKNAEKLSLDILCSDDPEAEFYKVKDAVVAGQADTYPAKTCDAGKAKLLKMVQTAQQFGVRGTPYFVVDGQVVNGADPAILNLIK